MIVVVLYISALCALLFAQQLDPHKGELGEQCENCHTVVGWKPSTFTVQKHQGTSYPLLGKHLQVECARCHPEGKYKRIPTDCFTCHQKDDALTPDLSAENQRMRQIEAERSEQRERVGHRGELGKNCADCHKPDQWKPSTYTVERHNRLKFQLEGAHADAKCARCHPEGKYKGIATDCFTCHRKDDALTPALSQRERVGHQGQLGIDCARCHTVRKWKETTFNHEMSKYKLVGKHRDVKCVLCHVNRRYKGLETGCVSCHLKDDERIHRNELGQACESCHTESSWAPSTYKHSERFIQQEVLSPWRRTLGWLLPESLTPKNRTVQYKYELTGQHRDVKCNQCHKEHRYKLGLKSQPMETACVSCHRQIDPHLRRLGTNCESCHSTAGWK